MFPFGVDRYAAQAPAIVSVVLGATIALQLFTLVSTLVRQPQHPSTATELQSQLTVRHGPHFDVGAIQRVHLFGATAAAEVDVSNAPPTALPLELLGTLVSNDVSYGMAIVKDPAAGTSQLYFIGQSLPGGAVLRRVHAYQVLFENHGTFEVLTMVRPGRTSSANPSGLMSQVSDQLGNSSELIASTYVPQGDEEREAMTQPERIVDRFPLIEKPIPPRDHDE